jgi:soluble lytic murein transglycosylase-like protein
MHRVKSLIISLGLILVAQVALAAEIKNFTDSQGVLHITNTRSRNPQVPVQPSKDETQHSPSSLHKSPSTAPAPKAIPVAARPGIEPRLTPGAASQPSGVQVRRSGDNPGIMQKTPGPGGEEAPGIVAKGLKRIAWTPPQSIQATTPGKIICYKDQHQVMHITNMPPAPGPEVPVPALPAVQKQPQPAALAPPVFQRISWPPPEPAGQHPNQPPDVPSPGLAENTIRRFRDSRGVRHINNEPAPGARPPPALEAAALARASPVQVHAPPVVPSPPIATAQVQGLSRLRAPPAGHKVSVGELGPEVVAYIQDKLRAASLDSTGPTISRFRDIRGVWHIANKPAPGANPPLALAAAASDSASPAQTQPPAAARPVDFATRPEWAGEQSQALGPTVIARRDRQGVLHIFTSTGAEGMLARGDPASFLNRVPPFLQAIIVEAAHIYDLPVTLVLAIIRNESNFTTQAVSPKGAMGLMQLMPGTATSLGVEDPFAPRENVLAGCRYFRSLLDTFQGSVPLALAAYNAGYRRVISAGWQVPDIKETQNFVTQVMGLYCYLEKRAARL